MPKKDIENNTIVTSKSIEIYDSECYQNGIKINCSDMPNMNLIYIKKDDKRWLKPHCWSCFLLLSFLWFTA